MRRKEKPKEMEVKISFYKKKIILRQRRNKS
jgi:hypothetical protein